MVSYSLSEKINKQECFVYTWHILFFLLKPHSVIHTSRKSCWTWKNSIISGNNPSSLSSRVWAPAFRLLALLVRTLTNWSPPRMVNSFSKSSAEVAQICQLKHWYKISNIACKVVLMQELHSKSNLQCHATIHSIQLSWISFYISMIKHKNND